MKLIINCTTGEVTEEEYTEEELAQIEVDRAEREAEAAALAEAEAASKAAAVAGRTKLADLGLSDEEITALVGPPPSDDSIGSQAQAPSA